MGCHNDSYCTAVRICIYFSPGYVPQCRSAPSFSYVFSFIFGKAFGIIGMIIGVPLTATIIVIVKHVLELRKSFKAKIQTANRGIE